jgi:hypothetical protein
LLDNATTYSPPDTEVWVHGQPLRDRLILQVIDQGVGLSAQRREQLNVRLAASAAAELTSVRSMGLMVVGRLASRHRLRVELRAGPQGGTVAEVTIPWNIMTWSETVTAVSAAPAAAGPRVYGNDVITSEHASIRSGAVVPAGTGTGAVNGWFQSRISGPGALVVWPASDSERWAVAPEHGAPTGAAESDAGLPMRTPQPNAAFAAPHRPQAAGGLHRRLDPAVVATAMSAYARAVRDSTHRRADQPPRRPERPS